MQVPPGEGHLQHLDALFARRRSERGALLATLPAEVRAWLPFDATAITEGIEHLAAAVGIEAELRAARDAGNRANPAVLHGRVFGRAAPLSDDTVLAAFADGARVRQPLLGRLAEAVDGAQLRGDVQTLLDDHPVPPADAPDALEALDAVFAAQEQALRLCARRLDEITV
jgi:hypothetical protein